MFSSLFSLYSPSLLLSSPPSHLLSRVPKQRQKKMTLSLFIGLGYALSSMTWLGRLSIFFCRSRWMKLCEWVLCFYFYFLNFITFEADTNLNFAFEMKQLVLDSLMEFVKVGNGGRFHSAIYHRLLHNIVSLLLALDSVFDQLLIISFLLAASLLNTSWSGFRLACVQVLQVHWYPVFSGHW